MTRMWKKAAKEGKKNEAQQETTGKKNEAQQETAGKKKGTQEESQPTAATTAMEPEKEKEGTQQAAQQKTMTSTRTPVKAYKCRYGSSEYIVRNYWAAVEINKDEDPTPVWAWIENGKPKLLTPEELIEHFS